MKKENINVEMFLKNISTKIKSAFTLVELIVVITILAILATIAFLSFQNFSSNARDSNRLSDLSNAKKGLEVYVINVGTYPVPEGTTLTGNINGQILSYVGEFGDTNSKLIKSSKTLKDPLSLSKYIYGTSSDYKYYQIRASLENSLAYNPVLKQANAATLSQAVVEGNYPGYIKYSSGTSNYIANVPSLLFNNTGSVSLLSTGTYYVVNKKTNLPYNTIGVKDTSIQQVASDTLIKEITKSTQATLTGVNITGLSSTGIAQIFTGTVLESFNTSGLDTTTQTNATTILATVTQAVLNTTINTTPAPANSCATQPSYSGATFTVGSPTSVNQTWQGTTSTGACYYTCGIGKVLDDGACVLETCSGTTPDGTAKVSNATSFAGGTWNYNPAGAKCSYTCGTGYHTEDGGATCISNTKTVTCGGTSPSGVAYSLGANNTNVTWNTGTSQWGATPSWTYDGTTNACKYACGTSYHTEDGGTTCISNTKTVTCGGTSPSGVAYSLGANTTNVTWNTGTSQWGATPSWTYDGTTNACKYACNTPSYAWNSGTSTCVSANYFAGAGTSGDPWRPIAASSTPTQGSVPVSCQAYNTGATTLNNGSARATTGGTCGSNNTTACLTSGVYWIDPDGATTTLSPMKVYCDMIKSNGGRTLVGKGLRNTYGNQAGDVGSKDNLLDLTTSVGTNMSLTTYYIANLATKFFMEYTTSTNYNHEIIIDSTIKNSRANRKWFYSTNNPRTYWNYDNYSLGHRYWANSGCGDLTVYYGRGAHNGSCSKGSGGTTGQVFGWLK